MRREDHPTRTALSRRRFISVAASMAGGTLLWPRKVATDPAELRIAPGMPKSRVVQVQNPNAVLGPEVHRPLLGEMLQKALMSLTTTRAIDQAWRSILRPEDVIGLKFNQCGQKTIATTKVLADVLIKSIVEAGWRPEQIVCIEAPQGTEARNRTTPARRGYVSTAINFKSGTDQFASVLDQITALISIPFLKTHNIAGLTCTLKNLSHGLVRHPARYHQNGCSPYIADIVAAAPIRSRLRLCLVDALRVVYDGGPQATAATVGDEGILLASLDPVATDTVGLAILNEIRQRYELDPIFHSQVDLGYIGAAHRRGLGAALWHGIDLVRLKS